MAGGQNTGSLLEFAPDMVLIGAAIAVVLWDLVATGPRRAGGIVAITLGALGYVALDAAVDLGAKAPDASLFYGQLASDRFASLFRLLFALASAVVVLILRPTRRRDVELRRDHAELYALILLMTLGMSLLAASRSLLLVYLSIELVSLPSFILAGYKNADHKSSEAALKYVIYGVVASGLMLYGMSLLYGISGSLYFGDIAARVAALSAAESAPPAIVVVATAFILAGFGYKVSAAPFHMWTPDVYEGAPTAVTALLSVGPKAAGFAVLLRFFAEALPTAEADSARPMLLGGLAVLTMTIGNLSALGQNNVKRMLAYSSVAHAGYMLLGLATLNDEGFRAVVFYTFAYALMNLGAFLVVLVVAERRRGDETLTAFAGLGRRAPLLALTMGIFLASLMGLPPLVGFVAKFYLFMALLVKGDRLSVSLAVIGVINTVIALFYYARVLHAMYFQEATPPVIMARPRFVGLSLALAAPTLMLGVYWGPLYDVVASAVSAGP